MGKIGLAISPQDPDVVYAAIELERRKGGLYRSTDRGASWEKRSDTVSGGTGPHYYQELYASPHAEGRLYLADVRMQVSDDGGKTFRRVEEKDKHSDNHALAFRKDDPDYLLVGTDGGLYETFDLAKTWRFAANLPVTQFYKIAVDDAEPFYNVYGGTQDNSTQGGPCARTASTASRTRDWFVTLFADGYQPATEPGNPKILYSEWQGGNLSRVDRTTGERVYVQPQPEPGDPAERFNWDAPILVSPHSPDADLLRLAAGVALGRPRRQLARRLRRPDAQPEPHEAAADGPALELGRRRGTSSRCPLSTRSRRSPSRRRPRACSTRAPTTASCRSPRTAAGRWRRIEVGTLPGVPASAFVNDVKADLFDADTVYVALDDHKSRRLHAVPAEEQRPRPQLAVDRRRPAAAPPRVAAGAGSRQAGPAVRRRPSSASSSRSTAARAG